MLLRTARLLLVLLSLLLFGTATQVLGQNCFSINGTDTVRLGDLLLGARIDSSIVLVRDGQGTSTVKFVYFDTLSRNVLRVTSHRDSVTLNPGTTTRLTFSFTSTIYEQQYYFLGLQDSNNQCLRVLIVEATGIDSTRYDSVFALAPGPQVYGFMSDTSISRRTLRLRNTADSAIVIPRALTVGNSKVTINSPLQFPVSIPAGETFDVDFDFEADSVGFHWSSVTVPNDNGLASEYTIQVVRMQGTEGSVPPIVGRSGVKVWQTTTELVVENISFERGSLELVDVLGRTVIQREISEGEVLLAKQTDQGTQVQEGCYFLVLRDARHRNIETLKILLLNY
jgi:hypothetical protein